MKKITSFHDNKKNIDLQEKYNIVNAKQQSFTDLASIMIRLVSYNDVKDIFLSRRESFGMQTTLNMNQNLIHNLKDAVDLDEALNLKQLQNSMSTKADLRTTTTQQFKSCIQVPDCNESSHSSIDIVNLTYLNDVFLIIKKQVENCQKPIYVSTHH